jgi:hypothetical protein
MLQIVVSLIDAARGVIYDRHMFIVQATGKQSVTKFIITVMNFLTPKSAAKHKLLFNKLAKLC